MNNLDREFSRRITGTQKPSKKRLFYAILAILLIFIVSGWAYFHYNLTLEKIYDYFEPKPQVLVTTAIGQHVTGKQGMPGSIDQKSYLAKITEDHYYLIFELKSDYDFIPGIFFTFDNDTYCSKCFYHTTEFTNIGDIPAENIVFDVDSFSNKIEIFYQDRRIKRPQDFGGYGFGGVRFEIDRLEVGESARVAYRIDEPKEGTTVNCLVDNKIGCMQATYYYKVMPWGKTGITFNDTSYYSFPKDLPEGVYKINMREAGLTSIPMKVISEQFGVKDFG